MNLATLLLFLVSAAPTPEAGQGSAANVSVASVTSESGKLKVEVFAPAQPLRRGLQRLRIHITEQATGKPAPGLQLAIQPWMPNMGHGVSELPTITEPQPGDFEISELDLFMPGTWELRLTLSGVASDKAVVVLKLR